MNERITEGIVRKYLEQKQYYNKQNIRIEEQKSENSRIEKCLQTASKSGQGMGKPEFIISFSSDPTLLIIIECKADIHKHESKSRNNFTNYAVDGVLLYASFLSKEFNIIAIAVSGQNEIELKISQFIQLKGAYTAINLKHTGILNYEMYIQIAKKKSKPLQNVDLIRKSIHLNDQLNSYRIPETERCTLVSCILTSLQDKAFAESFLVYEKNTDLVEQMLSACKRVLEKNEIGDERQHIIVQEYSKIKLNQDFISPTIKKKSAKTEEVNTVLKDLIIDLRDSVLPFITENDFDILGRFYSEFIRYAGSDSKTGLVLTPWHITELFCELVDLQPNDIVFDPCCGTGGFLVAAMKWMMNRSGNNQEEFRYIKSERIIGIEKRADMFTHACSNMMMRGDGKSHIYINDCFKEEIKQRIKKLQPNVTFLNPPYDVGESGQLEFVENAMDYIQKSGKCVAICQSSTVVGHKLELVAIRERLLKKHTLDAVFSMPNDLFHPVGVVTCILLFTAHKPHQQQYKTFFGYYKNDGFVKNKSQGRIDSGSWCSIKDTWLKLFKNKESQAGLSITQQIIGKSEWCAEAYLETDYTILEEKHFIQTIKKFIAFLFLNDLDDSNAQIFEKTNEQTRNSMNNLFQNSVEKQINEKSWSYFSILDLFDIKGTKSYTKSRISDYGPGKYPYVVTSSENNGVQGFYNHFTEDGGVLTIDSATVGSCFYQAFSFSASDHVEKLIPKFKMNIYIALFLQTIIELERYRYGYGRKFAQLRIKKTRIKLPCTHANTPDWEFMEEYMKSLPYSQNLA